MIVGDTAYRNYTWPAIPICDHGGKLADGSTNELLNETTLEISVPVELVSKGCKSDTQEKAMKGFLIKGSWSKHAWFKGCGFKRCGLKRYWLKRFCVLLLVVCPLGLAAAETDDIGEGGLHTQDWFLVSFKDLAEDIEESRADGKRLAIVIEQTGCIYCRKMHEVILADENISGYVRENFNIVQLNLFGAEEVTDLDGEVLTEKDAAKKWGVMFTPTILFLPDAVPEKPMSALRAAVAALPGGFGKKTFLHSFEWVQQKGYDGDEHLQKYHARRLLESQ